MAAMFFVVSFLFIVVCFFIQTHRKKPPNTKNLPPESFGWPFLGETLAFLRLLRNGNPERFVRERIERHGSPLVFKTSVLGERMAVFCGPEGSKFLFGNENKLAASWWPDAIRTLFRKCLNTSHGDEAKWLRKTIRVSLRSPSIHNPLFCSQSFLWNLHLSQ